MGLGLFPGLIITLILVLFPDVLRIPLVLSGIFRCLDMIIVDAGVPVEDPVEVELVQGGDIGVGIRCGSGRQANSG